MKKASAGEECHNRISKAICVDFCISYRINRDSDCSRCDGINYLFECL